MYPLAHVYFAEKALKNLNAANILGSIFPDIGFFSGFDWYYSHSLGDSLWRDFHRDSGVMVSFCRGVISHGIKPQGLDYYSDQKYRNFERGYCYEKARPLVEGVIQACHLASADGWWKAHNFIEMGVELFIFEQRPELLAVLQEAFLDAGLIRRICNKLALSMDKQPDLLEKGFLFFRDFVARGPMDARSLALRYQDHISLRHNIPSVNLEQCEEIIERGKEIIIPDIENFFADVQELMLPLWQLV